MFHISPPTLHRGVALAVSTANKAGSQKVHVYTDTERTRRQAYYAKYRDMHLTCLRELTWCNDNIAVLERHLRKLPEAYVSLKTASEAAKREALKATEIVNEARSGVSLVSNSLAEMKSDLASLCSKNTDTQNFKKIDNIIELQHTIPARAKYLRLRRDIGFKSYILSMRKTTLEKEIAALEQSRKTANALEKELKTLKVFTGGERAASMAVAVSAAQGKALQSDSLSSTINNSTNDGTIATKSTKKKVSYFRELLTKHRGGSTPWEKRVVSQIQKYKDIVYRIKVSQMPFKEEYRRLVFEEKYGEAESILIARYRAVMAARMEKLELKALIGAKQEEERGAKERKNIAGGASSSAKSFLESIGYGFLLRSLNKSNLETLNPAATRSAMAELKKRRGGATAQTASGSSEGPTIITTPAQALRVPVSKILKKTSKMQAERIAKQRAALAAAARAKKE